MPTGLAGNSFDDVESGSWYWDAASWAVRIGLVSGYGNNSFGPQDPISREQLVTILFRYAQYKAYNVSFGGRTNIRMFEDALKISAYANQAVQWAIAAGIMQGDGAYLIPQGEAARAQVAAMLKRFIEYYSY